MDRIEVSAPGKLVLFGEYAVLFGAPPAGAAVDRPAVVTQRPFEGDGWALAAPRLVPRPAESDDRHLRCVLRPGANDELLQFQGHLARVGLDEALQQMEAFIARLSQPAGEGGEYQPVPKTTPVAK